MNLTRRQVIQGGLSSMIIKPKVNFMEFLQIIEHSPDTLFHFPKITGNYDHADHLYGYLETNINPDHRGISNSIFDTEKLKRIQHGFKKLYNIDVPEIRDLSDLEQWLLKMRKAEFSLYKDTWIDIIKKLPTNIQEIIFEQLEGGKINIELDEDVLDVVFSEILENGGIPTDNLGFHYARIWGEKTIGSKNIRFIFELDKSKIKKPIQALIRDGRSNIHYNLNQITGDELGNICKMNESQIDDYCKDFIKKGGEKREHKNKREDNLTAKRKANKLESFLLRTTSMTNIREHTKSKSQEILNLKNIELGMK